MTKFDTPETREAFVLVTMERAHFKLLLGDADETKEAMDKCEKILDLLDSVDLAVHASFYRVSGDYWKVSFKLQFSFPYFRLDATFPPPTQYAYIVSITDKITIVES